MDEWAKGRDKLEMRSADLKCMLEIETKDQENEQAEVNALDPKDNSERSDSSGYYPILYISYSGYIDPGYYSKSD
jgi:hypothetical protein